MCGYKYFLWVVFYEKRTDKNKKSLVVEKWYCDKNRNQ